MPEKVVFFPERRSGLIFHAIAILVSISIGLISLWNAIHVSVNWLNILYLLLSLTTFGIVAWLIYRLYALMNASYCMDRDSLQLKWGLRYIEIPVDEIEWMHPASDFLSSLPSPYLHWPGSILGRRTLAEGESVEFMASTSKNLILLASADHKYAISPRNVDEFLQTFKRYSEMGCLKRMSPISIYPTTFFSQVWATLPARILLIVGTALNIVLLAWTLVIISPRQETLLGFFFPGTPQQIVPEARIIQLLVISISFYFIDLLLGLFFFHHKESQLYSYLLWISGMLSPLLFFFAVLFILRAP